MSQRKDILLKEGNVKKNGDIFHTFTSRFLLPIVGATLKDFGPLFLNAYIVQDEQPKIYVICKNIEEDAVLTTAIIRARINPNYIDTETFEDEIIIKFKIKEEDLLIYKLFIAGKYSKFPEYYKQKLIKIYGKESIQNNRYVTEYNVIYPQDFKRKQIAEWTGEELKYIDEVLDSPNLDYEVYIPLAELKSKELNGS